jgi:hypothetical protein
MRAFERIDKSENWTMITLRKGEGGCSGGIKRKYRELKQGRDAVQGRNGGKWVKTCSRNIISRNIISRNIILSVPNCMKSTSSADLLKRMRAERPRRWDKDGGGRRFQDDVAKLSRGEWASTNVRNA